MDQETLINHLSQLSKEYFDIACQIVLSRVFNIRAINIDGPYDGGTDFVGYGHDGARIDAAYQVTVQKKDIEKKFSKDLVKAIRDLDPARFYFLTSTPIPETRAIKLGHTKSDELGLPVICWGSRHIAGFLLEDSLLNVFLDKANYPLPRGYAKSPDYKEMALYGYTIMSDDARGIRDAVYDETVLYVLAEAQVLSESAITERVEHFLSLAPGKDAYLKNRIGALFSRHLLQRSDTGLIQLAPGARADVSDRRRLYERELYDLAAAQVDIMRQDFGVDWTIDHSREVSVIIADGYISRQLEVIEDAGAKAIVNPILNERKKDANAIKRYIMDASGLQGRKAFDAAEALVVNASNHPLVTKLARAAVFVALEGANPIVVSKALGAARWSDFNILVEPTVAIPWICAQLYQSEVNIFFDSSKTAIRRARTLRSELKIPYYYISECASHLLRARNYINVNEKGIEDELRLSPNAFIANYYSLKRKGVRLPPTLMDYLKTFSSAVQMERADHKEWVRAIMIDIQSILTRSGIEFVQIPFYGESDCIGFQTDYAYAMQSRSTRKPKMLIDHDVWALQFTQDQMVSSGERWIILTYDKAMIDVGKKGSYRGWVATPDRFLDLTAGSLPLSEAQYVSLLHSLAASSERTLAMAARILDRVIQLASDKMQDWEFKVAFDGFKESILRDYDLDRTGAESQLDVQVDEFLKEHGIDVIISDQDGDMPSAG